MAKETQGRKASHGPARLLPRRSRSPAVLGNCSAPPSAPLQAATLLEGGAVTIILTACTWGSSSPGPQLEPSRTTRGPSPDPHNASPPPLDSLTDPRSLQRERKGDGECLFSHACNKFWERVCSGAQGPQRSPCPWDSLAVSWLAPGLMSCWAAVEAAKDDQGAAR